MNISRRKLRRILNFDGLHRQFLRPTTETLSNLRQTRNKQITKRILCGFWQVITLRILQDLAFQLAKIIIVQSPALPKRSEYRCLSKRQFHE